jgi:hypothetical protein
MYSEPEILVPCADGEDFNAVAAKSIEIGGSF